MTWYPTATRYSDMNPDDRLRIMQQEDGDMIVSIVTLPKEPYINSTMAVEFCTRAGGGRSPKTLLALKALMEAMKEDEKDSPQDVQRNAAGDPPNS